MYFKQCINIKFYFKSQKCAKEAHEILKSVFGDSEDWLQAVWVLKSGNELVEDKQWLECPSTSKTDENKQKWFIQIGI